MSYSQVHSRVGARDLSPLELKNVTAAAVQQLGMIGFAFDHSVVQDQIHHLNRAGAFNAGSGFAMDSAFTAPVTTASVPTPVQFLQSWLPGFVKVMTAARKIDEIVGITTLGSWEDEEIVQGIVEPAGVAGEYGDMTSINFTNYNANFERRTIVRGELGMQVGVLEEARAAKMRLSSADTKRTQTGVALEIMRNAIGFFGWQGENGNRTFGFLNDPNLPAFITAPSAGWSTADFQAIIGDIRFAVQTLRIQSMDQIDPLTAKITFALPTSKVDYLSATTDFGISVADWVKQTYKNMRIVSAPELSGLSISGGAAEDVCYMFVEDVDSSVDGSTDDGATFVQMVQTKLYTLGVEKKSKTYIEDFSNATAGVMCKRPWAVVRMIGI